MYKEFFDLTGKNIVVMGGSGIIGQEISRALAEFGATVCLVDVQKPADASLLSHKNIIYYEADLTGEAALRGVLDKIIGEKKRVHGLVNSAYPRTKDWGVKFEKIPYASTLANFEYQFGTCFLACQIVAEHMKKSGGGNIVNVGSTYGVVGPDFSVYGNTEMTMPAAYSAIKGGVINFTRYLAAYYGRDNVRVNCLSPGGVFNNQPAPFVEKYSQKTPLGRMAKPQDMAGAVVYLLSEASAYVTGHNLMVDGGWTAW